MAFFDLSKFYSTLDTKDKLRFRDELMKECDWSYPTFYNKIKNNSLSRPEITVINLIISRMFEYNIECKK